jgi:hypothetical protein
VTMDLSSFRPSVDRPPSTSFVRLLVDHSFVLGFIFAARNNLKAQFSLTTGRKILQL